MNTFFRRAFGYARIHKILTTLLVLLLCFAGYRLFFSSSVSTEAHYVLGRVQRTTLISSVTGSGQVSASNQFDLKAKASGDVMYVGARSGMEVKAGTLIAELNARDAQKAVRDAEANELSAELALQKLQKPADSLSLLQSENTALKAKEAKQNAKDALTKAYDDAFTSISNTFLDLPTFMTGLQDLLYKSTRELGGTNGIWNIDFYANAVSDFSTHAQEFKVLVNEKYARARTAYEKNMLDYKEATRLGSTEATEALLAETYETSREIAEVIKSANNLIQLYKDELSTHNLTPATLSDTHLSLLNGYTGGINGHLTSLLAIQNTIQISKDSLTNADRSIAESEASLAKLRSGADDLDLQSAMLTVKERANALADAKENLGLYFLRAPFDATVGKVSVKKGDPAATGGVLATLLTKEKFAELSLNEVDVSKIHLGDKVTLTFDAVDGLSLSGKVSEIEAIGTVSQGVVTYAVKISFDTDDARIKSGMSVSASIITSVKPDVLSVPSGAVKSRGGSSYVEVLPSFSEGVLSASPEAFTTGIVSNTLPTQRGVEVGMSNDTATEIVSGLSENEAIIFRTISATKGATTQAPSLLNAVRGNGGGGGNAGFRALR